MGSNVNKPKVLLIGSIDQYVTPGFALRSLKLTLNSAHQAWGSLGDIAELVKSNATNRSEFLQECQSGKFEGVTAIYRTLPSITISGKIDEEVLKALPNTLRFIANCGMSPSAHKPIIHLDC